MNSATHDDYFWLVSPEAAKLISYCQDEVGAKTNVLRIAKSLRKVTTPARSAIILELAQLRVRARKKFPDAEIMFMTRRGYEQATSALIARYKATKFAGCVRIADLCCGIGGDLMSLANRYPECETTGVDNDPLLCLYAKKNLAATRILGHADVVESEFSEYDLSGFDAIHIDPDRRRHGRTVQSNFFSPSLPEIFERVTSGHVAIKVAPASPRPENLPDDIEREWIGNRRECKQQMLWCGRTASRPGAITATCVNRDGTIEQVSVQGDEFDQTAVIADRIGAYVFEPHPTVLAAKLTDTVASRSRLARLAPALAYLTGDDPVSTSLLTRYQVIKVSTLNLKTIARELAGLDGGLIEVKNRGVEKTMTDQVARIKLDGTKRLTVLLTRHRRIGVAIIAQRERGPEL